MQGPPHIFVVEDDPDARAALVVLITDAGYAVSTAGDGQQALDLLMHGYRPKLMIVDLMLPNVSGSEFLHYIQTDAELRLIPRIVVTAMPEGTVRVVADVILYKPCDFDRLLETIRRLVPLEPS